VDLWQQRRTRAIQKCILTRNRLAPMISARDAKIVFNPKTPSRFYNSWSAFEWQDFRSLRLSFGMAASLSPETTHAQEYPWCVSRESYLDCAYTTHEQCQWTASGIGGCALNPRLLFPNTSRHPEATFKNQPRDLLSRGY
jgi:hypothetical protein